jgi:hypothetical protein
MSALITTADRLAKIQELFPDEDFQRIYRLLWKSRLEDDTHLMARLIAVNRLLHPPA